MNKSLKAFVLGVPISLGSALGTLLCASLVFDGWIGEPFGNILALFIAAGVFVMGFIATTIFAVSKMGDYDARRRGGISVSGERDVQGGANKQTPQ